MFGVTVFPLVGSIKRPNNKIKRMENTYVVHEKFCGTHMARRHRLSSPLDQRGSNEN